MFKKPSDLFVTVEVVRGGRVNDDRLMNMMAVPREAPVYAGVMEIIDRLEEENDDEYCDIALADEVRLRASIIKATVRELRKQIESWRVTSLEKAKNNEA